MNDRIIGPAGRVEWEEQSAEDRIDEIFELELAKARREQPRRSRGQEARSLLLGTMRVTILCQLGVFGAFIIPWTMQTDPASTFSAFVSFSLALGSALALALLCIGSADR